MCWHFCAISGSFLMHTFYCMAFLFAYFLHLFFCISFLHFIFCLFFCIYFFASFFMHLLLHLFFASFFCSGFLMASFMMLFVPIWTYIRKPHFVNQQFGCLQQPNIIASLSNPSKIIKPSILVNLTIQSIARSFICLFHSMGFFHTVSHSFILSRHFWPGLNNKSKWVWAGGEQKTTLWTQETGTWIFQHTNISIETNCITSWAILKSQTCYLCACILRRCGSGNLFPLPLALPGDWIYYLDSSWN